MLYIALFFPLDANFIFCLTSGLLDGFLSPNRDIIVLITKDNMYIHKIIGDKISTNSIGEFPLKDGDSVVSINWYIFNSAVNVNKLLEEIK